MVLPDVSILICAFRKDAVFHDRCLGWLRSVVTGSAAFGIAPNTLAALVRVTTNRRAYVEPSSLEEAFRFSEYLLGQEHCRVVEPGSRHWSIFRTLCNDAPAVGPLVTDAWYAALAIEHGCTWITLDRDFARFPGLRWSAP